MDTNQNVINAIDKLAKLCVINSPNYWKQHYTETKYLDALIEKAMLYISIPGSRSNSVDQAIDTLVSVGIINTPGYWRKQTKMQVCELLKALGGAVAASIVTEQQLRQHVCDIMAGWLGAKAGDMRHLEILSIYNNHKPLARGYRMTVKDHWCAATVSAAYIKAGISEYTGTECSVGKYIDIAKSLNIWQEDDRILPNIGDACVYDWDDGTNYANTDNKGHADHIGIVTSVSKVMGIFTVTEGNMNGKVGKRTMRVNGRYIRGFITPDFEMIAEKHTKLLRTINE